jgi:1-aminocyclopropane-1-carboxylate deaminase/D-cysteine desulfhydrase-like pyridoxal-dependent ACC family enzyme
VRLTALAVTTATGALLAQRFAKRRTAKRVISASVSVRPASIRLRKAKLRASASARQDTPGLDV